MKIRLLQLTAGCVGFWLLMAYPAYYFGGDSGLLQSVTAALLCALPMAATQIWSDLAFGKSPEQQLAATLGGTGIRMVFVLCGGMALYLNVQDYQATAFWLWIIVFYLFTLTLEITLVIRRQTAMDEKR